LGLRFPTHSRIFFSSEYFHYKTFINENCLEVKNDTIQDNVSRPGIIDARACYLAAARRLRNPGIDDVEPRGGGGLGGGGGAGGKLFFP